MNLHLCSWAPAVPVTVNCEAFMDIWQDEEAGSYTWRNPWLDKDVSIFDERCIDHLDNGDERWALATDTTCDPGTTQTTPVTPTSQTTPTSLAFTGTRAAPLAGLGASFLAAGAIMRRVAVSRSEADRGDKEPIHSEDGGADSTR